MKINYLDLFSGVGGFTRGLLDAGFKFGWHGFSEIDKHAAKAYLALYPDAIKLGDINDISIDNLRFSTGGRERINVITFGSPCSDLSIIKHGEGLSGEQSGLFFKALRIVEAIRPDLFIFENVKGLLGCRNGTDLKLLFQRIADTGLYDCQWQLIRTDWFLPQYRERFLLIGLLRGQNKYSSEIFPYSGHETNQCSHDKTKGEIRRCHIARTLTARQYASWDGNYIKYPDGAIRQLTPRECFRLQFGKESGDEMMDVLSLTGISDRQLYRMSGMAVPSPIIKMIAERLKQVEVSI